MAGETWKSHQMTTRERDARMDEDQQLGDLDTAAHDHDEWMFGPEDDQDTGDFADWMPENYRLVTLTTPGGSVITQQLHVREVARLLAEDAAPGPAGPYGLTVTVEPVAA